MRRNDRTYTAQFAITCSILVGLVFVAVPAGAKSNQAASQAKAITSNAKAPVQKLSQPIARVTKPIAP